mmetsp:Transcript_14836/g.22330  ORF Transcript_14836/g.22330 Transcript_14836/m.22330 type:complete len:269 (-) Transcript_14836:157-963(-)|eukprot:CAMPEP_0185029496 /NCGR_PEP_ID=MMETSP1103-20130426/15833_1 /TAXON_ID=36769 /ORGANISM="Paraphysomonas bandaiensis, Strain Caron Lab Isolate" /LENGTH=268 /DNA_ID=CAMNT_0027564263 /DNA_START=48 /DNA_END=854 /DNA_ORIENTATION=-
MASPTTVSELITTDYTALFPKDSFFSYFSHPIVPFLSVALYLLLSDYVFEGIRDTFKLKPKGPVVQNITIVHSAILAVYSGWTFYNSWGIVINHLLKNDYWTTFCDSDQDLWTAHNLEFWITHFYISKFYEFIDTWIVIMKGRRPIFLQVYHHAGIVILMWLFVVTKSTGGGLIILTFNSFIHTLMYTYYTLAAFGYQSPLKHYLTQAQLTQFILGIAVTTPLLFSSSSCINDAQRFSIISIDAYALILIYLFGLFYIESYSKKKKAV